MEAIAKINQESSESWQLVVGDCSKDCLGHYLSEDFWQMNPINSYSAQDFIAECKTRDVKAILPTRNGDLKYFSGIRHELKENNIYVMAGSSETTAYCLNKRKFYEEAPIEFKAKIIPTLTSEKLSDSQNYVVKENEGFGSINIGINLTRKEAIDHANRLNDPITQPYIEGKEFSADLYCDLNSSCKGVALRWRELVRNGESQVTTIFRNQEIEDWIASFAEKIKIVGHAVLQGIIDKNGDFHIIEINPRIGGASTLSIRAGLDSINWFLLETKGESIPTNRETLEIQQLRMIRTPTDTFQNG